MLRQGVLLAVLGHIIDRGAFARDRLVIAEAVRHPALARLFCEYGFARLEARVEG